MQTSRVSYVFTFLRETKEALDRMQFKALPTDIYSLVRTSKIFKKKFPNLFEINTDIFIYVSLLWYLTLLC